MFQETTIILKGKLGMLIPVVCMVVLGAAFTIASYGYGEGGTKFKVLGPMCLFFAVVSYFGRMKITISSNRVAVKRLLLGIPIEASAYEKTNIRAISQTADGIQFFDQQQALVRTLEGFEDQQQLEEIYSILQKWLTMDQGTLNDPSRDQSH